MTHTFRLPPSKLTALDKVRNNLIKAVNEQIVKTGNPYLAFESINVTCINCKKVFTDNNFMPDLPKARRVYCDKCTQEMWEEKKQ